MSISLDPDVYPALAIQLAALSAAENLDEAAMRVTWIDDEMGVLDSAFEGHIDTLFGLIRGIQDDTHRARFDVVHDQITKDYVYAMRTVSCLTNWIADHGKKTSVTLEIECATFDREQMISQLADIGVYVKDWNEHEGER
jgi:site-specific recombinase